MTLAPGVRRKAKCDTFQYSTGEGVGYNIRWFLYEIHLNALIERSVMTDSEEYDSKMKVVTNALPSSPRDLCEELNRLGGNASGLTS